MQLRKAGMADTGLAALAAHELWPDSSEMELEAGLRRLLGRGNGLVLLLTEGEKTLGFAQCCLRTDYVEGTESCPVGYLEGLYIDPKYQRRGLGSALLLRCEEWAREKGCREFASDCAITNADSREFHLSAGFTEAGRIICFTKKL